MRVFMILSSYIYIFAKCLPTSGTAAQLVWLKRQPTCAWYEFKVEDKSVDSWLCNTFIRKGPWVQAVLLYPTSIINLSYCEGKGQNFITGLNLQVTQSVWRQTCQTFLPSEREVLPLNEILRGRQRAWHRWGPKGRVYMGHGPLNRHTFFFSVASHPHRSL